LDEKFNEEEFLKGNYLFGDQNHFPASGDSQLCGLSQNTPFFTLKYSVHPI